jgi:hypothetical protein
MADDAVDDLSDSYVLGLRFSLDLLDERFLNVQRPALGRSRRLIRGAEEMFPLATPGKNFLKISEIRERDVNVDIGGSTFVDIDGLSRKCSF